MKSLILILGLSLIICAIDLERQQKRVDFINKLKTTWTAKIYERDIADLVGTWPENEEKKLEEKTVFKTSIKTIPESYDLREAYPQCEALREIRDQSCCDGGYFSSTEVMSDRLCIHSSGKIQTRVSAAYLISCCTSCGNGCLGGIPSSCFSYWINSGIPSGGNYGDTTTCYPYFFPSQCSSQHIPSCPNSCQDGYPKTLSEDKSYGASAYSVRGEENMKQEIYENGSISATFSVYEDFGDYASGVYQHVTGSFLGGLSVKIIGWGVTSNGVKYWIIANSWNETWGEKGYFRLLRGTNECGIEGSSITAMPKL